MVEVKKIPIKLAIKDYLITFSYETKKGHYRQQQRTLKHFDRSAIEGTFKNWSKKQRTMLNVKILGIDEIKENIQEFVF